jgi:hypothetical protein
MCAMLFMDKSVRLPLINQGMSSRFDTGKHILPKQAGQRRFSRGTPGIHVAMTYVQRHGIASFLEPQQQVALSVPLPLALNLALAFSCHLLAFYGFLPCNIYFAFAQQHDQVAHSHSTMEPAPLLLGPKFPESTFLVTRSSPRPR